MAEGGTFITFPALTGIAKLSEKAANITSAVGLWPGYAASIVAARQTLRAVGGRTGLVSRSTSARALENEVTDELVVAAVVIAPGA